MAQVRQGVTLHLLNSWLRERRGDEHHCAEEEGLFGVESLGGYFPGDDDEGEVGLVVGLKDAEDKGGLVPGESEWERRGSSLGLFLLVRWVCVSRYRCRSWSSGSCLFGAP